MTGITRSAAAKIIAEHFDTSAVHVGGTYDTYTVEDDTGRKWKVVSDASIQCQSRGERTASRLYAVEVVSPICKYEDIETIQELVRELRRGGAKVNDSCGIHISPVYDGALAPVTLHDAFGPVHVWLLPFVKPAHVRRWFPGADIESYTDAVAEAVAHMAIDTAARNVLVTHQFVTGGARSGSEELSVGGTDNVDSGVFAPFDYVALGHLHGAQHIGRETIRYAGSPLKYSFSEARQHKSVTVVTLGEKGDVQVRTVALTPLRELREIRGSYNELTARSFYEHTTYRSDYLHLILTDEQDVFDAMSRLRTIYPYLMTLDYDNARTRAAGGMSVPAETERRTPPELFEALYQRQNHRPMSEVQRAYIAQLMEQIMEVQG